MRALLDRLIALLITVIMAFMVIAVCWQVFTRYVLNDPSTVTEEMLRYLLIWVTMVGAAYAYGRRKHLAINMLPKKLKGKNAIFLNLFLQALVLFFCFAVLMYGGYNLDLTAEGMVSAVLGIPMIYIYSSLPLAAVLFIFYALCFVLDDIKHLTHPELANTDSSAVKE